MRRGVATWAAVLMALVLAGVALGQSNIMGPTRVRMSVKEYERKLKDLGFSPNQLCVHSIGQSHIDAAWRWRLAQTHTKVYRTWGQALDNLERHRDFTFSGSASQYYEWLENDHPEVLARIVDAEKKGRWELVGGSWIEPDCNMPEGEAFVRQRLLGQRYYLEHFGKMAEIEWMLDSFGYNKNLPQFAARSGAKFMWTSKPTWNDTTIFPFHNFFWRAPDGSQVLTHICPIVPLPTYFPYKELGKFKATRYLLKPGVQLIADYETSPDQIQEALSEDWLNEVGSFYGLGDGGLGPREIEIEIQEGLAEKGYAHSSFARELFDHIAKCADRLPVWADEMYAEYHRGVMTTHSWLKRTNRMMEQMMRSAETLRAVTSIYGVPYPGEVLKEIWKVICLNQFHDILPGSSIPEVYEDAKKDYARIQQAARDITDGGLVELAKKVKVDPPDKDMDAILVFNALGFARSGLVRIVTPSGKSYQVFDKSGTEVTSQGLVQDKVKYLVFRAEAMPSIGYRLYYVKQIEAPAPSSGGTAEAPAPAAGATPAPGSTASAKAPAPEAGATATAGTTAAAGSTAAPAATTDLPAVTESADSFILENEQVKVVVDKKQGEITSVKEKNLDKELVQGSANKLLAFYDRPKQYSAWEISKGYEKNVIPLPPAKEVLITAQGPLFVEVLVRRELRREDKLTTFEQRIRLVKNDPVVYLDLDSDYQIHDSLTKLEFNTALHGDTIAADGPYLAVERPAHPQLPAEKARWEMPCQKWIDFSTPELGLALLNNGKYGFSLNPDGTGYRLTVIKSARYPRANPGAENVKHNYPNFLPTGFTDLGPQHAELGLLPHAGGWRQAKLWEAGLSFNTPLEGIWTTAHKGKLGDEMSFISLTSDSAYIGAVKLAEDDGDLIVRLIEAAGQSGAATLNVGEGLEIESAQETDLLELNPADLSPSGASVSLDLGPYQIRTVKIKVKK